MLGRSRSAYNQDGALHKVMRKRINDEPWFVGKDVAEALAYKDTVKALRDHVDPEDKCIAKQGETPYLNITSPRGLYIINESGLYSLILSSKLTDSKKFKRCGTQTRQKQLETTLMMKIS